MSNVNEERVRCSLIRDDGNKLYSFGCNDSNKVIVMNCINDVTPLIPYLPGT